jgi:hypothetical protein
MQPRTIVVRTELKKITNKSLLVSVMELAFTMMQGKCPLKDEHFHHHHHHSGLTSSDRLDWQHQETVQQILLMRSDPLPALLSICDCPLINNITGFDDNDKSYAGWTCSWCPLEKDLSTQKHFCSSNATKSLIHVSKITGYDIRPCQGHIPAAKSKLYQELYLSKTVSNELRKSKKDVMSSKISNIQYRTVVSLADHAIRSSRQSL